MHRPLLSICLAFAAFCFPALGSAQATPELRERLRGFDSTSIVSITLTDGSSISGRVIASDASSVIVRTGAGPISVPFDSVRSVRADGDPEEWFPNPNETRLFFGPTGRMLKKGDGYFAVFEVFLPSVAYGITDNFTLGGGVSIFPFLSLDEQAYYFLPKVGTRLTDKLHIAAGALVAGIGSEDDHIGVLYGVSTFGVPNASVTAGVGFGFAGRDLESEPVLMLGGERRLSRRMAVVTENYILPSELGDPVISAGIRFLGEKLTVDLGAVTLLGEGEGFVPILSFVFKF